MENSELQKRLEEIRLLCCAKDRALTEAVYRNGALYDAVEALVLLSRESDTR